MALTATEQDILNIIGKLRGEAGPSRIAREAMISPEYAGYLCKCMAKNGYLELTAERTYKLRPKGKKFFLSQTEALWDKETIKEIAGQLAKELGKSSSLGLVKSVPKSRFSRRLTQELPKEIKIKESFISPFEVEVKLEYDFAEGPEKKFISSEDLDKTLRTLKKLKK